MWRLTRSLPGAVTAASAARRSAVGTTQRGLAATAKLVDLDEEYPGLPSVTSTAPSPVKVETTTLPSGVKVVSTDAGKVSVCLVG